MKTSIIDASIMANLMREAAERFDDMGTSPVILQPDMPLIDFIKLMTGRDPLVSNTRQIFEGLEIEKIEDEHEKEIDELMGPLTKILRLAVKRIIKYEDSEDE